MASQNYSRFRRHEASAYLKEKWGLDRRPATLAKYASVGGGPKLEYAGRIPIYPQDELDIWAQSIFSALCSSTAQKPNREAKDCSASSTESATGGS
jgi:hypothetical protein